MLRVVACVLTAASVALAGCRPSSEASADVAGSTAQAGAEAEAEIRRLSDDYVTALQAGDVDRLVAMYASDAVIHEPGLPAMRGEAAIRQHFAEMADFRFSRIEISQQEIMVAASGDLAFEAGYSVVEWEANGVMSSSRGPYVLVLRRQDGEWRVVIEIFNSDQPMGVD